MRTPLTPQALAAAQEQLASKLIAATEDFLRPQREKFQRLLGIVCQAHSLSQDAITRPGKTRRLMAARREAVAMGVELLCPPLNPELVGGWLNLSRATAYRLLAEVRQRAETDEVFRQHLDTLRSQMRDALNPESSNG